MKIISREDALAGGLLRYFTGCACRNGHLAERFVSTKGCVPCQNERTKAWKKSHPEKTAEYRRVWVKRNPERNKAIKAAWNKANPEGQAKRSRQWFLQNRDKANAATAAWQKRNPESGFAWSVIRRLTVMNRTPAWADKNIITSIYKLAKIYRRLGFNVHVDHIIPVRGALVSGLHVHQNLQLIPASANLAKSNMFTL